MSLTPELPSLTRSNTPSECGRRLFENSVNAVRTAFSADLGPGLLVTLFTAAIALSFDILLPSDCSVSDVDVNLTMDTRNRPLSYDVSDG